MSVMLGGILSVWREYWSGDGVPRALQYSIFSHGRVVGVLFGIERVVIGAFYTLTSLTQGLAGS